MAWTSSVLQYWSVLGLAAQSSRWEQAMTAKLVDMISTAQKAATLQTTASEHQIMATQAEETALTEEEDAATLQEEAAVFWDAADTDTALTAATQAQVETLEASMAVEESEAVAYATVAAGEEITAEVELADATAEAAQAAQAEAQAHGEEVGIGLCEFIPFLDVACDLIGGVMAVGLEGLAATEATKASTDLVAATVTRAEEEREVALTADWQAKAAEDAAAAAELEGEEAVAAERAEEERVTGEAKEAEAEALLEEAGAEEETAVEEASQATVQEEEAGSLAANAITQGVLACWDAIMASVFGILSSFYFTFRMVTNVVAPATSTCFAYIWNVRSSHQPEILKERTPTDGWRYISYAMHHCGLFVLTMGLFSNLFDGLEENSLKARGGIILGFGFVGAFIQTILLHSLPAYLSKAHCLTKMILHGARFWMSLSVLYTLEILIVWVSFGPSLFSEEWLGCLDHFYWWLLLLLPLVIHLLYLEVPQMKRGAASRIVVGPPLEVDKQEAKEWDESDTLLPTANIGVRSVTANSSSTSTSSSWWALLQRDLGRMQLPFEILMLSCMIGLLLHCLSSSIRLWPVSKALLWATRPAWLIPVAVVMGIGLVAAIITAVIFR